MAELGGKCESNQTGKQNKHVSIHQEMTDAGQYSYAALCALGLRMLFEENWNREFNKETLTLILNGLEQPKQVHEAIHAMYSGAGQDDMHPFVDVILNEDVLKGDASPVVSELISIAVSQGNYDARMRALIKHVAWRLHISWDHMEEIECQLAASIISQKYVMSEEEKTEQEKKAKHRKFKRAALIGLATVTGGTLIGLTGGLAAPLVAAGAGAIIGGAGAAALGSTVGVAIIGSLFGVAGAGLTGFKMKKRVGAIEEFEFEPLISGGPLQLQTVRQQLHITIAITGWIDSKMPDFKQPWQNLAESQEQYTLKWESGYLKDLGQALDYIFNSAVSIATHEALKYTVLSTLMAAITWPAALLSVSQVIDNPWSVALQRATAAGRQLAEVLLSREQGKRPVTLIGYSLGGRVIFYCLEEMAKRRGCEGIVEDVIVLGAPVTSDPKAWAPFQRVVAGRIINGYCRGDWLLKFLYRTASIQIRIAGLGPVKWTNHRMHNIDLSDVVSGHLDYMNQLDTILRVVGIRVRQEVRVARGTGLNPSLNPAGGASKGTSPVESPHILVSSVSDSSIEKKKSVDLQTYDAADSVSSGGGKDLVTNFPSSGEATDEAGSEKQGKELSTDLSSRKVSSESSQSVGGSSKDVFPGKAELSTSKKDNGTAPASEQNKQDCASPSCNTDHFDLTVKSFGDKLPHVDVNQRNTGTKHGDNTSPPTSTVKTGKHCNQNEERKKGNPSSLELGVDVAAQTERAQRKEGKLVEGVKKEEEQEAKTAGRAELTMAEDGEEAVVVGVKEKAHPHPEDSEEDSYTSSNPGSSPDEDTTQEHNFV
ncbi:transmembrane and coiled-coil domain-containing protein 4-like isoform X2 [Babylonia areolata]|uniref:transmembrane and coiled-coil domain-containing protein 4-like isoform X2 n=1 Tax=Babylonia areolata TaxID=304850 RepID=UPI003FD32DCD